MVILWYFYVDLMRFHGDFIFFCVFLRRLNGTSWGIQCESNENIAGTSWGFNGRFMIRGWFQGECMEINRI